MPGVMAGWKRRDPTIPMCSRDRESRRPEWTALLLFRFDQVQASLLLVIREVRCRGELAALRAPVMVAYLWVETSQESLSHR